MSKNLTYYKDLLKLGDPKAPVGIVTLWTICDQITKNIDKKGYSVAGQLYTKNGINYLVRNLLANKNIRYIVVCGQDRSGSGAELMKLWKTGKSASLQKEIKTESVGNLIENVKLINLVGEEDGKKIEVEIGKLDLSLGSYGEAENFPEPEAMGSGGLECHFPTDSSVFKVRGKTIADTWLKLLKTVLRFGDVKETDAMKIKEIANLAAVVTDEDPENFFVPDWLGFSREKIEEYLPQIVGKEKNPGLHYTYGNRLQAHFKVNQLKKIIAKLKKDRNTREAVGTLFDPTIDHDAEHRPCIVLIQALYNQEKLHLNAYVRSHDLFGGWPLNAFGLRRLQKNICDETKLLMGPLTIISASAHVYDFNWDEAQKITAAQDKGYQFEEDPRGYFKIEINRKNKEIIVSHFSPEGSLLETIKQDGLARKASIEIAKKIDQNLGISLIAHALDLGAELQKAETAIKLDLDYIQDEPLKLPK
ncbi:MAG: thymidylate synthase [Parcubacteria group bacterium]|jgi:thymidylate synthase